MKNKKKVICYFCSAVILILVVTGIVIVGRITELADEKDIQSQKPSIVCAEMENNWNRGELETLPEALDKGDSFSIDFRHYDWSETDLSEYRLLEYACFDTDTIWPEDLYHEYDPELVMELGKNPGLGVERLHEQGITGKGVKVAVIDSALLLDHVEYADRIMLYERLHCLDIKAEMHGAAVTSILAGKNTGVAPEAEIYYIATTFGDYTLNGQEVDLGYVADAIERILEINSYLPVEDRIRVVSISRGMTPDTKGYEEVTSVITRAKEENVFVITCTPETNFGFNLEGLGRDSYEDPDSVESYTLGLLNEEWYQGYMAERGLGDTSQNLWVPMDSRTVAFCTGEEDYMFLRQGGNSCTAPWLVGLYALCVQVNPEITIDEFIRMAFETGDSFDIRYYGYFTLGTIINPQRLIEGIR